MYVTRYVCETQMPLTEAKLYKASHNVLLFYPAPTQGHAMSVMRQFPLWELTVQLLLLYLHLSLKYSTECQ